MDAHSIGARPSATTDNTAINHLNDCPASGPSRRALLAGMAALPLSACPTPAPARPTGVCAKLAGLIAAYTTTEAEYDRFCAEVYNPAVERQDALIAAIPHFEIDATLAADGSRMWSTREGNGSEARGIASIARTYQNDSPKWQDKMRRARTFTAADLRRKRAIDRTHKAAGLDAVDAQEDEICARLESTRQAIRDFPARTPSDLKTKLETLDQWLTHAELKDVVMSDLDSIQSREA